MILFGVIIKGLWAAECEEKGQVQPNLVALWIPSILKKRAFQLFVVKRSADNGN
jgi:hypothetical protein